ncbi:unnamed protein product [Rotaria sp. Silwood2]|nr:unnamed protein product [Rotaria sp. Silwood2]CAF3482565.1 unnamed protein product [Rotaria sp. Silwood2]CAF4197014.1 unnamed protein product [Rotaria sp. Silwood2]CAF4286312.1 unnamed protein product [Rotaria sp. Silwood2]CAF4428294.1 unnamed protein product [Rotaria sp. Silwood2]
MTILTVAILCPWHTTISLTLVYIAFFFRYVRQWGRDFLKFRIEANKRSEQLQEKHSRVASRTLDYYAVDYVADRLSFAEELLGKTCTLAAIGVLVTTNDNPLIVTSLYHYLSSLVDQFDNTNQIIIRCTRLLKEYDLILPILDEYETRFEAP